MSSRVLFSSQFKKGLKEAPSKSVLDKISKRLERLFLDLQLFRIAQSLDVDGKKMIKYTRRYEIRKARLIKRGIGRGNTFGARKVYDMIRLTGRLMLSMRATARVSIDKNGNVRWGGSLSTDVPYAKYLFNGKLGKVRRARPRKFMGLSSKGSKLYERENRLIREEIERGLK